MKLYRFSPIKSEDQLLEAIRHIHFESYKLCELSLGEYLLNARNIGIFCHYEDEYGYLSNLRKELTDVSDNVSQKYFKLHEPITISEENGIPKATYTHLYIRKPDPYRFHVGDMDFYLEQVKYEQLKKAIKDNEIKGARVFDRADLDMVELYNPDVDVLAYIGNKKY